MQLRRVGLTLKYSPVHLLKISHSSQDFKTNTGHGKLLLDDSLYPEAYATNVNEQVCAYPVHTLRLAVQWSSSAY